MEARPCQIIEFFNGTKQMIVPLFQRPYEWERKNWDVLWDDLLERYEHSADDAATTHFTGAIVTAPARSVPVGVSKYLVIDGQQRLTTVAILLCAIRSHLEPNGKDYRKLTRLLVNEDDEDLDHYKLLPTQPDRHAFQSLVAGEPITGTRFAEAFAFFRKKIGEKDSEGQAIDLDRLTNTLQNQISVVAIHLGESDDPYLIFESLNAKGAPLTQADLIRNYLLLRLHSQAQQDAYEQRWLPMQALLPSDHLTEFMRHYLMLSGEEVVKSAIYGTLKKRLNSFPDGEIPAELERMHRCSRLYARIVGLSADPDPDLTAALHRLRRWEVSVATPFTLRLLDARDRGVLTPEQVREALSTIESFVVRRYICRVPTNQMKRVFLTLTKDVPNDGLIDALRSNLASGGMGRRWPKDDEFRENWLTYRAYAAPLDRCRLILETLEEDHGHKEPVSVEGATIEHVLPQTLSDAWRSALGDDADSVHDRWVDTFGNLTLSAYNSELSNSPFEVKRKKLAESHFELNRSIAAVSTWNEPAIRERGLALFEQARRIWGRPDG